MASTRTPSTSPSPQPNPAVTSRSAALRQALRERVVVADGAMGTMLQAQDPTVEDFQGLEGCNEILNVSRPDFVRNRARGLPRGRGATASRPTPSAATSPTWATTTSPTGSSSSTRPARAWPARPPTSTPRPSARAGSSAPSARAPSCRPWATSRIATLRDAYQEHVAGLVAGGADALLIETSQDLLQVKAAVLGAKAAIAEAGLGHPGVGPGDVRDHRRACCWAPRSARR